MCVVSMVMDHYDDSWTWRWNQWVTSPVPLPPPITPQEVEEFRRLLDRAREYDKRNNEPDCELESKRKKIRDLAKELGVVVDFV